MKLAEEAPIRVLLFSLSLALPRQGRQPARRRKIPSRCKLRFGTILASNQNDDFDAKLKGMEKQLRVLKYRSYRLLKNDTKTVPWQGTQSL